MPRIAGLALAALMVLGFAIPAAASENSKHHRDNSTLFATGQIGSVLLAIDLEKGAPPTVIGLTGPGQPGSIALAITPDGMAGYTIAKAVANFPHPVTGLDAQLARINLKTGATTLVGNPLGGNLSVMGMTFSPDGVLYAAGELTPGPTFNSLYTIDLQSGLATPVGSLGPDFIMSFAFDSDGNMYGASRKALYRIHLPRTADARGGEAQSQEAGQGAKALATFVVNFVGSSNVMGIAIGGDGSFYAADFVGPPPTVSKIYAVDIHKGSLKPIFNTGIAFVHNIAFSPELQRGHHD